tara:strand:- start:1699 stop:1869 length:171 start_codon:yes stop_codon:yes gene_type:complete
MIKKFKAIRLVQGLDVGSEKDVLNAWQYLHDSGSINDLAEKYKLILELLIEKGKIK